MRMYIQCVYVDEEKVTLFARIMNMIQCTMQYLKKKVPKFYLSTMSHPPPSSLSNWYLSPTPYKGKQENLSL